jgi:hypothetical protein
MRLSSKDGIWAEQIALLAQAQAKSFLSRIDSGAAWPNLKWRKSPDAQRQVTSFLFLRYQRQSCNVRAEILHQHGMISII